MENGGAVAVIVYDNVIEGFIYMSNDGTLPEVEIPSVFIPKTEGLYLAALLGLVSSDDPRRWG